jgi:hypothetical protein
MSNTGRCCYRRTSNEESASAGTYEQPTRGRHGHVYFVAMVFSNVLASNASAAWSALACRLCLGGVGRIEAMPAPRAMLSTHNASRSLDAINLKAVISAYDDVIQPSQIDLRRTGNA